MRKQSDMVGPRSVSVFRCPVKIKAVRNINISNDNIKGWDLLLFFTFFDAALFPRHP